MSDFIEPMVKNENRYYVENGKIIHIPDKVPAVYHVRKTLLDEFAARNLILPGSIAYVYSHTVLDGDSATLVAMCLLGPDGEWYEIGQEVRALESDINPEPET